MRSEGEGFSFYIWGSGGWPVFAWPCFWRPQPLATVCNRLQPFATVCNRPSATVAGAKLPCLWEKSQERDFFDVSEDVVKSFCVAGAVLLIHVPKMCCIFRRRRSTLDTSDFILRGRRGTLDVSCCVFSANHIVSAARSGDKVQILWQPWHFVTCHENRRKPRTKRRFCSRSMRKLVGVDFDAAKCESCRAYNKSRPNVSFSTCHKMCSCRFAWQAWHFLTLHTLHFTLHTLHSPLSTPHPTLHTLHSTLYTLHSTLYTPHIPHFKLHTQHFLLYTRPSTLHTLHFTLHTLHFTPHTFHTLHSTLHTLHSTLYTPRFKLHTLHSTL